MSKNSKVTLTPAQQAVVDAAVAAALAQLVKPSTTDAAPAPQVAQVEVPSAKQLAKQAAREAARARTASKQAAGLAKIRGIAQAKADKGKVQLTEPAHLHIARTLLDVAIPADASRFTLSIGDKGWAFTPGATGRSELSEVPVTAAQAAELRSVFDALVVRKAAQPAPQA